MSLRNYGQTSTNGHLLTTGTSPTAAFSPHGGRKTVSIFLNIKMLYPPKKTGVILNPLLPKTATVVNVSLTNNDMCVLMLSKGFAFIKFPLTTQSQWTATPLYISTSQRSKSNIHELNLFNYATKHTTCRQETSCKQFMDSKDIRQKIASIKFGGCSCTTKCPVVSFIFYTFVENFLKHLFINCSEFNF